jgi:hypothetical protein
VMSERTWLGLTGVIVILTLSCTAILSNAIGHAEMKRWQDGYYAAHPTLVNPKECAVYYTAPCSQVPPPAPNPPKAKPLLCSGHQPINGEMAHEMVWTGECWNVLDVPQPLREQEPQPSSSLTFKPSTGRCYFSDGTTSTEVDCGTVTVPDFEHCHAYYTDGPAVTCVMLPIEASDSLQAACEARSYKWVNGVCVKP